MHEWRFGFLKVSYTNRLKMFLWSNDVKMIVNGTDFFDVREWQKFAFYSLEMSYEVNKYFQYYICMASR